MQFLMLFIVVCIIYIYYQVVAEQNIWINILFVNIVKLFVLYLVSFCFVKANPLIPLCNMNVHIYKRHSLNYTFIILEDVI